MSSKREGLRNYMPISKNDDVYGVNVIPNDKNNIYNRLTNPNDPLYQEKFKNYLRSDIMLDMQYFNNASYLMQRL